MATGSAPLGWRAPQGLLSPATLKLLCELGYRYDASFQDDDYPYVMDCGAGSAIVELPSFDVADAGADRFPSIFVELGNTETKYVRAVELHIGDRRVLHHMVLFQGPFAMTQDIVDTRSPGNRKSPMADMPKLLYVWAAGSPPTSRWS